MQTAQEKLAQAKTRLAEKLFQAGCIVMAPPGDGFTLVLHRKQGQPNWPLSPVYFDFRTWDYDPVKPGPVTEDLLWDITACFREMIAQDKIVFDRIVGIPRAGDAFAKALSQTYDLPPVILRKESIGENLFRVVSGLPPRESRLLAVENFVTTAHSILRAGCALFFDDYFPPDAITDALVVGEWGTGAKERLRDIAFPINLHALFTVSELMQIGQDAGYVTASFAWRVAEFASFLRGKI